MLCYQNIDIFLAFKYFNVRFSFVMGVEVWCLEEGRGVFVGWNYIKSSNSHFFTLLTFSNEELWLFECMNIHEAFHNKL